MRIHRRRWWAKYGVAVAAAGLAAGLRYSLQPLLGDSAVFILFVVPVMIAGSYGGLSSGLLATFLGALLGYLLFLQPLNVPQAESWSQVFIFILTGSAISVLTELLHVARRQVELRTLEARRQERAVRESELRFRLLIETAMEAIITVDEQRRIVVFNRAAETILGIPAGEAMGTSINRFIPERFLPQHDEYIEHFGQTGETSRSMRSPGILVARDAHGREFPIEATISQVVAGGQKLYTVFIRDITKRNHAQEEARERNRRLLLLSEISGELLLADDPRRIVQGLCERLSATLGLELFFHFLADEEAGKLRLWASGGITPEERESLRELEPGQAVCGLVAVEGERVVAEEVQRSEEPRTALLRSLGVRAYACHPLISRGRTIGTLSFGTRHRDTITPDELELMQTVCNQLAVALDRARLLAELHRRNEELGEANQAKDQFLAILSHELRTPLTPVLATVTALETDPALPDDMRWSIEIIRRNIELEARLIDDLLDLTRITRGKLQLSPQPVRLHELVRDAYESCCESDAVAKRVRMTLELAAENDRVWADPGRLQQVIWNLLRNAIKFTPGGGDVMVRSRNEDSHLVVEVIDTGIGIDASTLPRIFHPFEQGAGVIRARQGGLGLGLAISKGLVEAQGGTLSARSEGGGKGSVFTLALPSLAPAAPQPEPKAAPAAPPVRRALRILVVEDHADTAMVMSKLLSTLGHRVSLADGVAGALRMLEEEEFDLLISDLGLPDGNGRDLMRQAGQHRPIRGIALSGYGMESDIRASREAGFLEHITKPVNFSRLQEAIERVMRE